MNAPYSPIHYVYLVHEDINGVVSYANNAQMDIADKILLSVCRIFNANTKV
jgi:hypothetical protein